MNKLAALPFRTKLMLVGGAFAFGLLLLSRTQAAQEAIQEGADTLAAGLDTVEGAISSALARILRAEGGYVNDPADPGGPTNLGITLAVYQSIHPGATIRDLRSITRDEARAIYTELYIQKPGFDRLPPAIIPQMADIGVNSGPPRAIKLLQAALNTLGQSVSVDGLLGAATEAAAAIVTAADGGRALNNTLAAGRTAFYRGIVRNDPSRQKFLAGWLKRADSFLV